MSLCCGTDAGSYLRLIDSCITQLEAQVPSRTCNKRIEEEEDTCPCSTSSSLQHHSLHSRRCSDSTAAPLSLPERGVVRCTGFPRCDERLLNQSSSLSLTVLGRGLKEHCRGQRAILVASRPKLLSVCIHLFLSSLASHAPPSLLCLAGLTCFQPFIITLPHSPGTGRRRRTWIGCA